MTKRNLNAEGIRDNIADDIARILDGRDALIDLDVWLRVLVQDGTIDPDLEGYLSERIDRARAAVMLGKQYAARAHNRAT